MNHQHTIQLSRHTQVSSIENPKGVNIAKLSYNIEEQTTIERRNFFFFDEQDEVQLIYDTNLNYGKLASHYELQQNNNY